MPKTVILLCLLLTGCAAKKRPTIVVPVQCVHVQISDFTKPCHTINQTTAVCDGVVIHPTCTQILK